MRIWIDADACPAVIRDVLFRAADRRAIDTTLVANHFIPKPRSPHLRAVQVEAGFDRADDYIAEQVEPGDLVITGDIPLAAEVVSRAGTGLDPRGTLYTAENIHDHLARRDLMAQLRDEGTITSRSSALGKKDVQAFANQLDRYLAANARRP